FAAAFRVLASSAWRRSALRWKRPNPYRAWNAPARRDPTSLPSAAPPQDQVPVPRGESRPRPVDIPEKCGEFLLRQCRCLCPILQVGACRRAACSPTIFSPCPYIEAHSTAGCEASLPEGDDHFAPRDRSERHATQGSCASSARRTLT